MSISGFIFKLVLIQSLLYYVLLLRQIASLPGDLATGGGLTARFPPVESSWCIARKSLQVQTFNQKYEYAI